MNYTYMAYGLVLSLPFPCEYLRRAPVDAIPDVVVMEGKTPVCLDAPLISAPAWQVDAQQFLWKGGKRSGQFLVEAGQRIILERSPQSEDSQLAFSFLDTILAAILSQRGMLVLHANAARNPKGAIAISGESGAGKSTTLAALLQRGWKMLSDDITALRVSDRGQVEILPGIPQLHLTQEAANALAQDISGLNQYRWRRMKAAVPTQNQMAENPTALRAMYILHILPAGRLQFQRLSGAAKFAALQECVYGPSLPQTISQQFALMAAVVAQVDIIRVSRPAGLWSVDSIVTELLNG